MNRIALIGAGRIGKIHAANALAQPGIELAYVVDAVGAAAEELARTTGARVAPLDEIFADGSIAGVVIASSTDTHLELCLRAIETGKAAFCEKPLDLDLAKAEAAAPTLGQSEARLFLGFNRRFDPNFRRLRDQIHSGALGALETLHIVSHDPAPPPIDYVRVSGGLFKDMAIHDFDMARWLLGEEPVEVYAAGACLIDPGIGEAGDIDTAKTVLRTGSGKICVISNSRRSGYGYDQRIEAFCSNGLLRAGNVRETTVESWEASGSHSDPLQNFFLDRYRDAYRAEMAHFAGVVAGEQEPLVGYRDGVAALALADAAAESNAAKAVVQVTAAPARDCPGSPELG
ncbi:MAG TPA: inositol 2-dehydrogenase [Sphingomicrobium sp.]|nr:inositol 2-dehydrogenase [Sphingomicrobium sp.]